MNPSALRLEAAWRDGRSVLTRTRCGGVLRASRAFREGTATRVVVGQLGPGLMRGDALQFGGRVERGAHLIVAGQMATRVLSGPEPATSVSAWVVEPGATLELISEPLLVASGAAYAAHATIVLEPGARAVVLDLVRRERGAALTIATYAQRNGRLAMADILRFAPDDEDDGAIGTLAMLGMDVDIAALDRTADTCSGVRAGVGVMRDGDILTRVVGPSVWAVREALLALRDRALR